MRRPAFPCSRHNRSLAALGDALSLLRRGHRAPITRQQTLTATLDWSHNLLADDERVLFRRLAVFAGSFTLEAVEGVCVDGGQVLGALARLVDTSLVSAEARGEITRYRLLETVRQYGAERLRAAGEEPAIRSRHSAWYVEFAESRDPEVPTSIIEVVPASLDVEHDNLRAALTWALAHEARAALRLAVALWRYWLARGLFAEGRRWLEAVLTAVSEPSVMRARGLLALAVFDLRRGTGERLVEIGAETVAIHRAIGDRARLALALHADGVLAYMRGDWTRCWQRSEEAREAAPGADEVEASTAFLQAMVLLGRHDLPAARVAFEQARAALAAVRSGRPFFATMTLGWVVEDAPHLLRGDRAARAARECRPGAGICVVQPRLSGPAGRRSDEARGCWTRPSRYSAHSATGTANRWPRSHLGCLHRVRAEFAEGRAALEHSLRIRHEIGDRREIGLTLGNLGMLTAAEGDLARGLALLRQALAGFRETDDVPGRVAATLTIASLHAAAGDYEAARRMLPDALSEVAAHPWQPPRNRVGIRDAQRRAPQSRPPDEAVRAMAEAADPVPGAR